MPGPVPVPVAMGELEVGVVAEVDSVVGALVLDMLGLDVLVVVGFAVDEDGTATPGMHCE